MITAETVLAFVAAMISDAPEIIADVEKIIADFKGSSAGQSFAQRSAGVTAELKTIAGQ